MSRDRSHKSGVVGGYIAAVAVFVLMTAMLWLTGALLPTELPSYATSAREITGMSLMLIFTGTYVVAAVPVAQRRSIDLIDELRPSLMDPEKAEVAAASIRGALRRTWPLFGLFGLAVGAYNGSPVEAFSQTDMPMIRGSIAIGQLLLWTLIGLMFGMRAVTAREFSRLGEYTHFDLFRLDRLRPLARSGVVDVVLVVGALFFAPLQSLDAEFRLDNYSFALFSATTTSAFLLVWPLIPIHRRIRRDRDDRIEAVDSQIASCGMSAPENADATDRLETLLAHRDRLIAARTWPLGMRLLSRVVLYLIIPPLAWAGAALVERIVNQAIGS